LKTIIDASSLINVINGGVLLIVLRLPARQFYVGQMVLAECGRQETDIQQALTGGLQLLDEESLSGKLFLELLAEHGLGLGETECLAFALSGSESICCDDRRARGVCAAKLGSARVLGTARLLRECVEAGLITADAAVASYESMRAKGGFLPELSRGFFDCA
jgi:predicted nucleic acid-binding protein